MNERAAFESKQYLEKRLFESKQANAVATSPQILAGTGDSELLETIRNRIRRERDTGDFDNANLWQNYLHAVERKYLETWHFDDQQESATTLALFGGWSDYPCT